MGATNEIKGTNISLQLGDKVCPQCNQIFTEQEIDDRNFDIWFDTSNDVELKEVEYPSHGYQFSIWIRSIEHKICPTIKECQKCYTKFLEDNMIETDDPKWGTVFYCQPCHQKLTNKQF